MSDLLDKQVYVQKEYLSGGHASPRKPMKKCAMKMKEREKNNDYPHKNNFIVRPDFQRSFKKDGWMDLSELRDIDFYTMKVLIL